MIAIWVLLVALALGQSPATADYRSLYVLGLEAVDFERWKDGVVLFSKAIEQRPAAGGLVRPYGTWTESYVPHYYLGLCLFHLRRYSDALDAWDRFEAQPPYEYPRNRRKRQRLAELRRDTAVLIPRELERLRREVAAVRLRLAEVRTGAFEIERGGEGATTDAATIAQLLDEASRALEDSGSEVDAAEVLRGVRPLVDSARDKLLEQEGRAERLRREQRIARELEERSAQQARYADAVQLLGESDCSRQAIDTLIDFVHRAALGPSELGGEATPILRLAQAYLQCSEPERARQYLEMGARHAGSQPPEVAELMSRLMDELGGPVASPEHPKPSVPDALNAYLQASGWIDVGECRREAVALLEEAENALLADRGGDSAGGLPIEYRPFFTKARAFWNCRDRTAVEANLVEARRLGAASSDELDALGERLRRTPMGGLYGESHALVVISHDYEHDTEKGWDDLPGARDDLEAVRHVFATHGFRVQVLENPPSEKLYSRIRKFVARYGRNPANRLVLYFAGHGWTEPVYGVEQGYVVPVDSPNPRTDESFEYLISMDDFKNFSDPMLAKHALFIFDMCFGGRVFGTGRDDLAPRQGGEAAPVETSALLEKPVRMFLSAGDETETVPDFSVFRRIVLRGLSGEADTDGDELVLGRELGDFVRDVVSEASYTTPQWGVLTGGELGQGDIAFQGEGTADEDAARRLQTELNYWATVWGSQDERRYRDYLALYPDGRFAALAGWWLRQPRDETLASEVVDR